MMGRKLRRVPIGFDWPIGQTWWGFVLGSVPCGTCKGEKIVAYKAHRHISDDPAKWWCPSCGGDGDISATVEPPGGRAWQYWETTSDGSPITPPFATRPELAGWMVDNGVSNRPYRETLEYLMECGDV